MNIEDAIANRRSIFPQEFSGGKVEEIEVNRMLELANRAPTHKRTEPWRFKIYEGGAKDRIIDKICDIYIRTATAGEFNSAFSDKMQERKERISHMIFIVMKRSGLVPEFEEVSSVAMSVQNMWLYLASRKDIGGYWSTPKVVLSPEFAKELELSEDEVCLGVFYLGTVAGSDHKEQSPRRPIEEKVMWYKN